MILKVKVFPGARKNEIVGWEAEVLKVKIKAPPQKGKGNAALIEFLASQMCIPKHLIRILSGQTSRLKRIEIASPVAQELLLKLLQPFL